ncbi:transcriptional regulator [Pontibacillus halophilus JSM 076056 = DSM 19796]|uniref:Transcriptional regulator n=1 Tax=Pontibacillus halophilus JSM 076056 = DSM 19796 TaxID=1385510 RepID=A0A0A5GN04_9BACI|nr:GntR family transcriptional regulator [Pontibacillus halophilus]KGX93374.1 transcriptional regulator [Pontibacillus halophilus JSM 076056 = DSM 19796]
MSTQSKSKVYEEVLNEIRRLIEIQELVPGDKLPSEREMAEQLVASRSSVREALRAMELLGLIETRRGEGTFLRAYSPYHMVELLSAFILQQGKTKDNLKQTKYIVEKEAAKQAMERLDSSHFMQLEKLLKEFEESSDTIHFEFFSLLFEVLDNDLFYRIWRLMEEFSKTVHQPVYEIRTYTALLEALKRKNEQDINDLCSALYEE